MAEQNKIDNRHPESDSGTSSRHCGLDPQSPRAGISDPVSWFAARIVSSATLITKRLSYDGIHCYRTKFAPGIVFLRCTMAYASGLVSEYWGKIFFYLNSERKHPEPIPERQMNNFILVTSVSDDLIPLGEVTQELLKGDKVRVTGGLFEGAEGVIKRIKGDHRLIVSIDCFTAVATCFIRPEFLEKVNG